MPRFYSVDWGSTRLRVRLAQRDPFRVLADRCLDEGVIATHAAWTASEGAPDRFQFFCQRLAAAINGLEERDAALSDTPVVVSGMASSSIGMQELPYAQTPVGDGGDDLVVSSGDRHDAFPAGLTLVSGVATGDDVIRGEETEWLGLVEQGYRGGLYLLPGTHSKHLTVVDRSLVGIRTFFTGELFDVLSKHSVLAESVAPSQTIGPAPAFLDAVREAQGEAGEGPLGKLFTVRSRSLLSGATPREGAERLSGLLIGSELAALSRTRGADPVVLSGSGFLQPLYAAALDELGITFVAVNDRQRIEAVPRAHARLLRWGQTGTPNEV